MRSLHVSILIGLSIFLFSGCTPATSPAYTTKAEEFPKMYDQQPRSILILPPMNETTDAQAKDYYMTTIEAPFALMGYYVFPVEMVSDIMKQEGVYDTELLYNMPLDKFYEYFGADGVLFTRIKEWDLSYAVIASTLSIAIEAKIVSTQTNEVLWSYTDRIVIDLSGHTSSSSNGLADLLASAIATAINVDYARTVNRRLVYTLPFGPYSEMYMKDQNMQLLNQTPKITERQTL